MGKFFIKVLHEEPISKLTLADIKGGFNCTCNGGATFVCSCNGDSTYHCTCNGEKSYSCTCNNAINSCTGNMIGCTGASNTQA